VVRCFSVRRSYSRLTEFTSDITTHSLESAVVNGTFDAALLANAASRENLRQFVLVNHAYAFSFTPNVPDIKLSTILAKDTSALALRSRGVYLVKAIDAVNADGD
jgi:hypothetical protein